MWILIAILFMFSLNLPVSEARTIHVPGDYDKLSNAGRFAEGGDIIIVEPGVYEDFVVINTGFMKKPGPVTLQGSGAKNTIIKGGIGIGGGKPGEIFKIDGFTIEGGGIDVQFASIIISHCFVTKSPGVGVRLGCAPGYDIRFEENVIKDTGIGIACSKDENGDINVLIANNMITNSETGILCSETSPKLRGNRIVSNQIGIDIGWANPDIGTRTDPGNNTIYNNAKYDIQYSTGDADEGINAIYNYWGNPGGPVKGGAKIVNTGGLGWIDYEPWLGMDEAWSYAVQPQSKLPTAWGNLKANQR